MKNIHRVTLVWRISVASCFLRMIAFTSLTVTQGYVPLVTAFHYNTMKYNIPLILIRFHESRSNKSSSSLAMEINDDKSAEEASVPVFTDGVNNIPLSRIDAVKKMLQSTETNNNNDMSIEENNRRNLAINVMAGALLVACGTASAQLFTTNVYTPTGFRRLPSIQFIAALGDPKSSSGKFNPNDMTSSAWGIWNNDPGPRGVWLRDYDKVFFNQQQEQQIPPVAPAGWTFNSNDWWLEEHGIIMEQPIFPIKPGRYLVTGGRSITTGVTIDGDGNWKLDDGTLYDVTHLPCRSARYRQQNVVVHTTSTPKRANLNDFPVRPGDTMPNVPGYSKQDYAVLFLVGVATT